MSTESILVLLAAGAFLVAIYLLERLVNRRFDALERRLDRMSPRGPL